MPEPRKKVCVVLIDRANYGRLKPVMEAVRDSPQLEIQVLAAGTMVLWMLSYVLWRTDLIRP